MIYVLIAAIVCTTASLIFGLATLFKGGEFSKKYSNKAMQWRVTFQALALLAFGSLLFFSH